MLLHQPATIHWILAASARAQLKLLHVKDHTVQFKIGKEIYPAGFELVCERTFLNNVLTITI